MRMGVHVCLLVKQLGGFATMPDRQEAPTENESTAPWRRWGSGGQQG